ncbi:hypothetical protein HDU96_001739 [Phlyctochytrium bullatum]|nr:hypothetical protein HDU96_001739 [Phlyctochytrium bullatum]
MTAPSIRASLLRFFVLLQLLAFACTLFLAPHAHAAALSRQVLARRQHHAEVAPNAIHSEELTSDELVSQATRGRSRSSGSTAGRAGGRARAGTRGTPTRSGKPRNAPPAAADDPPPVYNPAATEPPGQAEPTLPAEPIPQPPRRVVAPQGVSRSQSSKPSRTVRRKVNSLVANELESDELDGYELHDELDADEIESDEYDLD